MATAKAPRLARCQELEEAGRAPEQQEGRHGPAHILTLDDLGLPAF